LLRSDDLNFEINEDEEVIDMAHNAENVNIAHAKRDLICETLRIRHV